MGAIARLAGRWSRSAHPRWTVRLRLTLVYGGVFLLSGVALLAITYFLVKQDIGDNFGAVTKSGTSAVIASTPNGVSFGFARLALPGHAHFSAVQKGSEKPVKANGPMTVIGKGAVWASASGSFTVRVPLPKSGDKAPSPKQIRTQLAILRSEANAGQVAELHQLLFDSGFALLAMAFLSILLGWLLAGRVLRPLRLITSKAQDISATNLHERIGLRGPDDEMKRLGATFDDLLARLERAFDAQRQFVANASHELRTPLARQRALLEVASADPDADVASLRDAAAKAIAAGEEQERLVEALLTLASSERGLDDRVRFDLSRVVDEAVESKQTEALVRGVRLDVELSDAPTTGSARLTARLVGNLLDNALRHNQPHGWVVVTSRTEDDQAVLEVTNSGPIVPADEIERLFEPFERLTSGRTTRDGHGLGLSIVRAVARAHEATVTATSREGGGLHVRVAFPLGPAPLDPSTDETFPGPLQPGQAHQDGRSGSPGSVGETVDAGSPPTGD